jgi:cytochrome b6-f complex iron-sulfur subunit
MTRRRLLSWLLSGSGGTLLAVVLYPIFRYIAPPPQSEAAASAVVAGKVKDFPLNSGKVIRFGTRPAIVVHMPGGEFRAFSAVCTHLACIVEYVKANQVIHCNCHNGQFNLHGQVVGGPPPKPLPPFNVHLVAGAGGSQQVVVSRS